MRTEQEMFELILKTAREDERIRGVCLEGSRVNAEIPKDLFQDYDIVYVVTETASFREDRHWIDRFGERLYMQYPEEGPYESADLNECYGWLIQLADGNRLDLHVFTMEGVRKELTREKLYKVLLDKDQAIPAPTANASFYWVKKPDQEQFRFAANEFWWCLNNVAKGLWREELPYVMDMLHFHIRPMLRQLLEWRAGADHEFSVSVGKSGKYLKNYLQPEVYARYLSTYSEAEEEAVWKSVFLMCDLFEDTAKELAENLSLFYDQTEGQNARFYLEKIYRLPKDACEIILD